MDNFSFHYAIPLVGKIKCHCSLKDGSGKGICAIMLLAGAMIQRICDVHAHTIRGHGPGIHHSTKVLNNSDLSGHYIDF